MRNVSGLVVLSVRCSQSDTTAWEQWAVQEHLPLLRALPGVRSATRFAVVPRPTVGMPGLGFTHVEMIELTGPVADAAVAVAEAVGRERAGPEGCASHAVVAGAVLVPHGPYGTKAPPTEALTGHILANVLCADPSREDEWDRWYDQQHLPDMLATGAFSGGSRWRYLDRPRWGAAHVTLYDIELPDVTDAVERSAAAMPDLIAQGRKHQLHCGGLTMVLERAEG